MSQLLMLTEKWIGRLPSGGHDAQTCLKLLETVAAEPTYQGFFVSIIPSILLALPVCIRQEEDKQCLGTLLRVLLNVTNENHTACNAVTSNGVAIVVNLMELAWDSSFSIFAEPKWNLLTLALGLLINLSESNLNHRDALGLLRTEKGDFIEFITLMVSYWWSNDREADQVIIAGYTALLLGCLAKDSQVNRQKIKISLESLTPSRSLSELSSALLHFLALHEHHRLMSPTAVASARQAARALVT